MFFYKSVPRSSYSKDKLQNAIHIILKGQEKFSDVSKLNFSIQNNNNSSSFISLKKYDSFSVIKKKISLLYISVLNSIRSMS